ncbi:glycosyltransferase family 2 protein [Qipengyuania sp.]|uniref:glycosyltransferase family 2 protein n=1 Tax=Qipengyuania sp. TaxID=2004515 RepID=UPI0035C7F17E
MVDISIIVPAHNVAGYVSQTLDSLLGQNEANFEVLLIDDGSTDVTLAILRRFENLFKTRGHNCVITSQDRGGAGSARNAALRSAQGRLIGFLDADDVLHPGALTALIEKIDATNCDLVFPLCRHIDQNGAPIGVTSHAAKDWYSAADLLLDNPIHSGSGVVVRAQRVRETGFFDTDLPACIDLDYWVRLTEGREKAIAALHRVLIDYRMRPGQITGSWRRMRAGWEAARAAALRRGKIDASMIGMTAKARNLLVWATAAYKNGEYADARALMAECWRADPAFAAQDGHARIRTAAVMASLLPLPLHRILRARFNG